MHLQTTISGKLRNLSFGALFDNLMEEAKYLKDDEARMISKLQEFRKKSFDGINRELEGPEVATQQYEISIDALVSTNPVEWDSIEKWDSRLDGGRGRYVVDLDRPITKYIQEREITDPDTGKRVTVPVLKIIFDYMRIN